MLGKNHAPPNSFHLIFSTAAVEGYTLALFPIYSVVALATYPFIPFARSGIFQFDGFLSQCLGRGRGELMIFGKP